MGRYPVNEVTVTVIPVDINWLERSLRQVAGYTEPKGRWN